MSLILYEKYRNVKGYTLRIRDNTSGLIVHYYHKHPFNAFWLIEGNYGCDCNRSADFQRALSVSEDDIVWADCGDTKYSILNVIMLDGTIIPIDDAEEIERIADEEYWIEFEKLIS